MPFIINTFTLAVIVNRHCTNLEMKKNIVCFLLTFLTLTSCLTNQKVAKNKTYTFKLDTLTLLDQTRSRKIPIAYYKSQIDSPKIVIFSHGYYKNESGSYFKYSYLTEFLSKKGYFVASIQHELPTDSLIPSTGSPQIVRRPFWERGADNILFVINELRKSNPELDFKHITLIGHSNGADMTALFPQKYSNIVYKIITLDNRRMTLPRTIYPKIYSLRSSDQPADLGVLPTEEEQKKYGITIIKLTNTIHNNMDNKANAEQRKEITNYVLKFLKE